MPEPASPRTGGGSGAGPFVSSVARWNRYGLRPNARKPAPRGKPTPPPDDSASARKPPPAMRKSLPPPSSATKPTPATRYSTLDDLRPRGRAHVDGFRRLDEAHAEIPEPLSVRGHGNGH